MVAVHVAFRFQGADWTHDFDVEQGATVRRLKELMVQPKGSRADVDAFELRQQGLRVPDFEPIWEEAHFDFMYLGAEEGGRRSARDRAAQESYARAEQRAREEAARKEREEEEARRLALRRQQEEEERRVQELARLEELERQRRAAAEAARKDVEVTVRHAVEELESHVTVTVPKNCTVMDVRLAVMAALGESKLSEVKLVKKTGGALTSLGNETRIGDRREFLSMGRPLAHGPGAEGLAPEAPVASELALTVVGYHDGVTLSMGFPAAGSVRELKARICEQVMRGPAGHVKLWLGDRELRDAERLRELAEHGRATVVVEGMALGPPQPVEVLVTHATAGQQARVSLADTASLRELREAVAAATGSGVADVRLVKRLTTGSGGWQSLPDGDRLHGRTSFHCMGRALEQLQAFAEPEAEAWPAFEDVELTVSVCLDSSLGIAQELQVKKGSTLHALKELLAEGDPTKRTRPEDFGLALASCPHAALPDDTRITEAHLQLELLPSAEPQEEDAGPPPAVPNVSGLWVMDSDKGEKSFFTFEQPPGSEAFAGRQEGFADITSGRVQGSHVEWMVWDLHCAGRLEEDGWRMSDIQVRKDSHIVGRYTGVRLK